MMWDKNIRKAHSLPPDGAKAEHYLEFMRKMQDASRGLTKTNWRLVSAKCDRATIPKMLDEYEYVTNTLKKDLHIDAPQASVEKAGRLLGIIGEIYDDGKDILTEHWPVLRRMKELANEGQVAAMLSYYENCLRSDRGQVMRRRLESAGRKTLEGQYERFRRIAMEL